MMNCQISQDLKLHSQVCQNVKYFILRFAKHCDFFPARTKLDLVNATRLNHSELFEQKYVLHLCDTIKPDQASFIADRNDVSDWVDVCTRYSPWNGISLNLSFWNIIINTLLNWPENNSSRLGYSYTNVCVGNLVNKENRISMVMLWKYHLYIYLFLSTFLLIYFVSFLFLILILAFSSFWENCKASFSKWQ
jgi:hypothetical protein